MAKRSMSREDSQAKRFEANQLFTPSAPIAVAELFAGRQQQAARIVDAIGERGRHIVLHGERGVGKSSMAQIIPFFIPRSPRRIRHVRVQAFPGDNFSKIAKRIFSKMHFEEDLGEGMRAYNVAQFYPADVTIDDFLNEMSTFKENEIPIIVIDEFNEVDDEDAMITIANALKSMSDDRFNATIIIVGVAGDIIDLFGRHESIERCVEQIPMPRMAVIERKEVLEKRLAQLAMTITGDAKWKIIHLSRGLPAYVHSLGRFACFNALDDLRYNITEADVDSAIDGVLASSLQSLKDSYDQATRTNQAKARFKHVLTACALAKGDDAGFFTATAIKGPLSSILKKSVEIADFQDMLRDFAEKRGLILERTGESRTFRFRFANPAMQPYVIMRGIHDGIVDEIAKRALSSPEQSDLFANG